MNKPELDRAEGPLRACTASRERKSTWIARAAVIAIAGSIAASTLSLRENSSPSRAYSAADFASPRATANASDAFAKLPLHFEPTRDAGSYVARGRNFLLELGADGATLNLRRGERRSRLDLDLVGARAASARGEHELGGVSNYFVGNDTSQWRTNVPHFARVRYEGVYPGVDLVYYGAGRDLEYDFIVAPGADPATIRMQYSGARDVRIDYDGNLRLAIEDGEVVHRKPVVYQTLANGVRASVAGAFRIVQHAANAAAIISFELGRYDSSLPLVIDPVLTYSSYLGSTDEDEIVAIAVDADGAVYVAGNTESANFPVTAGASQTVHGSPGGSFNDLFVAKLNAQGTVLEYATFLGGNAQDTVADIKVDAGGSVYVAGTTLSSDFPTMSAFDTTFGGGTTADIFVAHLNSQGTALLYSTYLGGARSDGVSSGGSDMALRVDSAGSAWILATTDSNDYPVTPGAPQETRAGDPSLFADDFVVTKLSADGASLEFSTYFGGSGEEALGHFQHERARAGFYVTDGGIVTIVGTTSGAGFPVTTGVVQETPGGSDDLVIVRLNSATNAAEFATYLGGSGFERLGGSSIDADGNIYVCGETQGPNYPTTAGAFDTTAADRDVFVTKLNPTATALIYSTLLGGSNADFDPMCRFDADGNAYVAGSTVSTDFPVTAGAFDTESEFDQGFIAKLNSTGTALEYASYLADNVGFLEINDSGEAYIAFETTNEELVVTPGGRAYASSDDAYFLRLDAAGSTALDATYIGGTEDEIIRAFVLAPSGDVYIAGATESDDFPTTPGAVQTTSGDPVSSNDADAFIVRIAMGDGGSPPPPDPQPGVVQFSAATYSGNENGGSVTLTLTRTNGADGAISVSVASGGGSAAAGSDYTALSQTVSWADGDAASKTVSLVIVNDSADEPDETVVVTLSNPTGGASLGSVSSATVTIVDDDEAAPATPPSPPQTAQNAAARGSYGGGGAMAWLSLLALAVLAVAMRGSHRKRGASMLALLVMSASIARADDMSGWYVGVRGGVAETTQDESDIAQSLAARGHSVAVDLDDREATWSVFGGFRWANGFGIEVAVVDLGEYDVTMSGTTNSPSTLLRDGVHIMADAGEGVSVSLAWSLALGERFALTPRIGGYYWESTRELRSALGRARRKEDGFDVTGGLSLEWRVSDAWSLGLAYDVWDAGGNNDVRAVAASLGYRFGR